MRIAVVGDTMLDVDLAGDAEPLGPDAPAPVLSTRSTRRRPGAAGLVATLLADDGIEVELITALSDDARAEELKHMLAPWPRRPHGPISIHFTKLGAPTPVKTRMRAGDHLLLRLHEDTAPPEFPPHSNRGMRDALTGVDAVIVADYGGGIAADPGLRRTLSAIGVTVPIVWHPHPHGALPLTASAVVTPNELAARHAARAEADADPSDLAQALAAHWSVRAVAVTCGERGAVLHERGRHTHVIPTTAVPGVEAAGAGDRFATAVGVALASGSDTREAVESAVAATRRYLADGGVAGLDRPPPRPLDPPVDVLDLTRAVRRHGGTVVATAGRFDSLDASHVRTLVAARALGDCLIVFIHGDASAGAVTGGSGLPLMSAADRRDLLMALACVDAVVVFDESDPRVALDRIRPDVFVKGDDADEVAEAPLVSRWGGRVVTVPFRPIAQAG
jgi:rfaE bifunctional protein nucleotidyltransferase chain/domain